jgi:glyoxylase I family protein
VARAGCISAGVQSIDPLVKRLEQAGVPYTKSMSGRPAVFFRDPDLNVLEVGEMGTWRE